MPPSRLSSDPNRGRGCDWDDEATLPALAAKLHLRAFEPDRTITTFPKTGKRLDWVFVSDEIEFSDYQVGDAHLSDHQPVVARLRITRGGRKQPARRRESCRVIGDISRRDVSDYHRKNR
ncbi:MAG: hypothetical protein ACYC6Y_10180 [Thermoguttaceae bacterium]